MIHQSGSSGSTRHSTATSDPRRGSSAPTSQHGSRDLTSGHHQGIRNPPTGTTTTPSGIRPTDNLIVTQDVPRFPTSVALRATITESRSSTYNLTESGGAAAVSG